MKLLKYIKRWMSINLLGRCCNNCEHVRNTVFIGSNDKRCNIREEWVNAYDYCEKYKKAGE